ncbi:hypothetical protein DH2020_048557 [Rehmannia glutinosa]|uniref:J domain-containing protein n=1 Tax=Rehmannia glutinosa TaxID=99300 RepID=A0ABR0U6B2_REHGL
MYAVLGVNSTADDETIKKQYRKLALMLHPDKNSSIGADGAFKLISEAWSLLSDKVKRFAYNQSRGYRSFVPTQTRAPPVHTGGPSVRTGGPSGHTTGGPPGPSTENQFFNFGTRKTSAPKSQKKSANVPSKPSPAPYTQRTDTFWTICNRCDMQYEYLKKYLNNALRCPNCHQPFMALEIPRPISLSKSHKPNPWPPQNNSSNSRTTPTANNHPGRNVSDAHKSSTGHARPDSSTYATHQRGPLSGTASVDGKNPSMATKTANSFQQAQDKLKRAYPESNASSGMDGSVKKRKVDDYGSVYETNNNVPQGNGGGFGSAGSSGSRIFGFSGNYRQPDSTRELTPVETRKLLLKRARKEILKNLNESASESAAKAADKEKEKTKERNKVRQRNRNGLAEQAEKHRASNSDEENPATVTMKVPDPDFYDFDQDRTESSFADNEVWSAYDNDDGMPRFYALIHKVISQNPFKLKISWLNSKTNTEFSAIDWVGSGFYKTCGEFRVGKHEMCKFINAFSRRVNWSKNPRGIILILPQKGDVWAMYKNWAPDWNERTPDEVIHKYDMVMVVDDYSEENGVSVAPLVKVVGFRTVFCPNLETKGIRRVPREEMFRFSHLVPHHSLTSQEAPNAPNGCLELDPAATPLEFLQMNIEEEKQTS